MELRALSVRQPWAHAIIHHGKDVENRTRLLGHRGWTLIHASAGMTEEEYDAAWTFALDRRLPAPPPAHRLERGAIIGIARIIDGIGAKDARSGSPWWIGPFGLVIDLVRPLRPIPARGTIAPLFWRPEPAVLEQVSDALAGVALPPA